jgi:hypothetical protein
MSKFLFLDFDGVLHSSTTTNSNQFFTRSVLLDETLEMFECNIVISSSWRFHYSFDFLVSKLSKNTRDKVIGATGDPYIGRYSRFNEITQYLNSKNIVNADWVSLDDSVYEFPEKCQNLIQCNPNTGLTIKECQLLKEWLSK